MTPPTTGLATRRNWTDAVKDVLRGWGCHPIKAKYDRAGNCTVCGEAGRCTGWHATNLPTHYRLTLEEAAQYVQEVDRRFRARTPPPDIEAVLPETRVGRGEMRGWFAETMGRSFDVDDAVALAGPLQQLFRRLRRDFPNERW